MRTIDIQETKEQHEDALLSLPNVIGVGIGEKNGRPVIKVFVTRKVDATELKEAERIPQTLEGYRIDVEEIGVVTSQ